jgi:hypothetical protein
MPLHDWKDDRGWDSVHLVWLAQLLDWVQPRLPEGYRAYLGSVPALTVDVPNGRPDMSVRNWPTADPPAHVVPRDLGSEPDEEAVATFTLDPQRALHVDLHGALIAALEIVSPRKRTAPRRGSATSDAIQDTCVREFICCWLTFCPVRRASRSPMRWPSISVSANRHVRRPAR